jgi:hypothetical protein
MKPSNGMEGIITAWNRWVASWKKSDSYATADEVPLRMRGYTEIVMGNLPQRERKAIDTSLRRGYSLAESNRAALILNLIAKSVDFDIGYLGKTRGSLWLPSSAARDACLQHLEAQLVMTEKFSAKGLKARGDNRISIQVDQEWGDNPLKSHMTELRVVVDEHMAHWAVDREKLANSLLTDDAAIRIPYDSHKGRNE